jgi:hypothetical protein
LSRPSIYVQIYPATENKPTLSSKMRRGCAWALRDTLCILVSKKDSLKGGSTIISSNIEKEGVNIV